MTKGRTIELTATDGHKFGAYLAEPIGEPQGGVVILQEIFGVTTHMQAVADGYAQQGYRSIVPALFDRYEPGTVVPYSDAGQGRTIAGQSDLAAILQDIEAAITHLGIRSVHTIGFCWGGSLAYLAACKLSLSSAVSYYGTRTVEFLDLKPTCPVMFHFGEDDGAIPPEAISKISLANPESPVHVYPNAGHAFNNNDRQSFQPDAAALAKQRTLEFLAHHSS